MSNYTYRPVKFFALTLLLTWASWFSAAYFSYQNGMETLQILLMIPGLVAPLVMGLFMVFGSGNRDLKMDFLNRLIHFRLINLRYTPVIFLLMPVSILLAIAGSLLFGMSPAQFKLSDELNIMGGQVFLSLLIPILAPTFEEIGWRGYGVDSLRSRLTLLKTSIVFALLWGLWHLPLFFINNYYQNQLWKDGIPFVINFFISILPLTVILNWLYYKNNRSILAAILFHIMTVISSEAFRIDESAKFIQTGILLMISAGLVIYNKTFFETKSSKKNDLFV